MKLLTISLLPVVIIGCNTAVNADKEIPSLALKNGTVYSVSSRETTHAVSPSGASSGDTLIFEFDLVPTASDSAGYSLTMIIRRLALVRTPQQVSIVKGHTPAQLTMLDYWVTKKKVFEKVENDSLRLHLEKNGRLTSLYGFENTLKHVSAEMDMSISHVNGMLDDYLSLPALRDRFAQLFFYLPPGAIDTSATWVNNTVHTSMAPVRFSHMMKVDSIGKQHYQLAVKGTISAGEEGMYYMKGTQTGTVWMDRSSGLPSRLELQQETKTQTTGGVVNRTGTLEVLCVPRR